jgi:CBS domain-containing protein
MIHTKEIPRAGSAPSTVADLMNRDVVTVSPSTSLRELVRLFRRHGISGAPVANAALEVVGMVSETDLMWLADRFAEGGTSGDPAGATRHLDERTVGDVMTADVFGVGPRATLRELAAFFARTGLGRAVVLEGGKLLGIVSVIDLLAVLADGSER